MVNVLNQIKENLYITSYRAQCLCFTCYVGLMPVSKAVINNCLKNFLGWWRPLNSIILVEAPVRSHTPHMSKSGPENVAKVNVDYRLHRLHGTVSVNYTMIRSKFNQTPMCVWVCVCAQFCH